MLKLIITALLLTACGSEADKALAKKIAEVDVKDIDISKPEAAKEVTPEVGTPADPIAPVAAPAAASMEEIQSSKPLISLQPALPLEQNTPEIDSSMNDPIIPVAAPVAPKVIGKQTCGHDIQHSDVSRRLTTVALFYDDNTRAITVNYKKGEVIAVTNQSATADVSVDTLVKIKMDDKAANIYYPNRLGDVYFIVDVGATKDYYPSVSVDAKSVFNFFGPFETLSYFDCKYEAIN